MSTEILNLEGDAVTRAEANMCVIVLVRIRTLRRCREDPFMLHNYSASNGESLFAPYQLRLVCGAIMYKWYAKVTRKRGKRQAVGWPNSTLDDAKSVRYKHRREVENGKVTSFSSHTEQT